MAKTMRLDKLLGHTGWGTRRELKELCKGGHVTVNGAVCRDSSQKIDPAADADDDSAFQSPAHYLEDHRYDPALQLEDADWSDNSNHNLHEALEVLQLMAIGGEAIKTRLATEANTKAQTEAAKAAAQKTTKGV